MLKMIATKDDRKLDPGPQRTSAFELFETAPQRQVNLLQQVTPLFTIKFISSNGPVERVARQLLPAGRDRPG